MTTAYPSTFTDPRAAAALVTRSIFMDAAERVVRQAAAAAPVEKSGDVRRVRRQHSHDDPVVPGARRPRRGAGGIHPRGDAVAVVHGAVRELRRSHGRRPQQGAGGALRRRSATSWRRSSTPREARRWSAQSPVGHAAQGGRGPGRGRRFHPRRRRSHRRRGVGGRDRHHRRIRAGHPRVRRRLLLGHRRHARALGLAGGARHRATRARPSSTA